jgi:4'-phosphopantetheinyl transferase EntD
MIAELVPEGVVTVEGPTGVPPDPLFAEEEAALGPVTETRRREFMHGRQCGRRALAGLGVGAQPILPGSSRQPVWPAGVVGSITHGAGWSAAAVAHSASMASVGIDVEEHSTLPEGVLESIADGQEIDWVAGADPEVAWDRLLFSAKEALYKAWYPLTERWLGFEDAVLTIDPRQRAFAARLLVPGPVVAGAELRDFEGRWLVEDGLVLTAIAVRP